MPSSWVLPLTAPPDGGLSPARIHAMVSRWFDPDTATHRAQAKPYAVSPPSILDDGTPALGVRLLDDDLVPRLLTAARPGVPVTAGPRPVALLDTPRCAGTASWQQIAAAAPASAWNLTFLSPTTFRHGNRTTPFPAPASILAGLHDRWQSLRPGTAPPLDAASRHELWVSDLDLRSVPFDLKGRIVSACTGQLRIVCPPGAAVACTAAALFALAPFAGVGSHTGYGFGTVQVDPEAP